MTLLISVLPISHLSVSCSPCTLWSDCWTGSGCGGGYFTVVSDACCTGLGLLGRRHRLVAVRKCLAVVVTLCSLTLWRIFRFEALSCSPCALWSDCSSRAQMESADLPYPGTYLGM